MPRSAALVLRSRRRFPRSSARTPLNRTPAPKAAPLWPFFLIAALVVGAFGAFAFARHAALRDFTVSGKVAGTPTPTAERPDSASPASPPAAFSASGSWTMSSLPECFFEQDHIIGRIDRMRAKFPPEAERVRPGSTLRAGNCTVRILTRELWISRGPDRLRVPPDARLYRRGDRLTLVWIAGRQAEIRHYCRGFDAVTCPTQSFPHPVEKTI